jgi:integrase
LLHLPAWHCGRVAPEDSFMASLQKKGDSWHCQFVYKKQRRTWVLGAVDDTEAHATKGKVEYLLMRIKQRLIDVPPGMDIVDFLAADGRPADYYQPSGTKETTFADLRNSYIRTHSSGTIEKNTLDTCKLHLSHWTASLGESFPINALTLADLQRHVDRRSRAKNRYGDLISATTIKKEVATLAGAWNWGSRIGLVAGQFPGEGLRYPKLEEAPPFMTWPEIERAIAAGGKAEDLWDCLFLTVAEITELLAYVKEHAAHPFIYPMFCFAALTGARRSEVMRALVTDLDFTGETVLIREKKRTRGKRTTRRVPLTPFLVQVLKDWLAVHPGGSHLFCLAGIIARSSKRSRTTGHLGEKKRASSQKGRLSTVRKRAQQPPAPLTATEAHHHFEKSLEGSKWAVLKGWHVLRHSFISACASKGTDQRLIDEWTGHSTEEQRRRYRHLWPSTQQQAIKLVFG